MAHNRSFSWAGFRVKTRKHRPQLKAVLPPASSASLRRGGVCAQVLWVESRAALRPQARMASLHALAARLGDPEREAALPGCLATVQQMTEQFRDAAPR